MGGIASIGVPGLIIILVIVLIIFGPRKLPEIGGAVGKTFAEFKSSTKGLMDDDEAEEKDGKDGKDAKDVKEEKKSEKV